MMRSWQPTWINSEKLPDKKPTSKLRRMCVSHDSNGIIFCSLGETETIYIGKNTAIARSSHRKKQAINPFQEVCVKK